jgi:hypothetical protein
MCVVLRHDRFLIPTKRVQKPVQRSVELGHSRQDQPMSIAQVREALTDLPDLSGVLEQVVG